MTDLDKFFEPFEHITEQGCRSIVFQDAPCPNQPGDTMTDETDDKPDDTYDHRWTLLLDLLDRLSIRARGFGYNDGLDALRDALAQHEVDD